jgi:hypothetical protein
MAEPTSGLGVDPTKMPIYGTTEEQQQKYNQTLQDQIKALENRYAQPNWFKVAAGFAKPQLGGFMASLGSASEALGENVEQQRAAALPIAQMRAQLAQSEMIMGSGKTQSDEFKAWQASKQPMDKGTYARLTALNPNSPIAMAAKAAYEGESKDVENTRAQQRIVMDAIQIKQAKGIPLSATETNFLQNFASGVLSAPEASRATGIAKPKIDEAVARRAQQDVAAVTAELSRLPAGDPRRAILNVELEKAKQQAGEIGAEGAEITPSTTKPGEDAAKKEKTEFYTPTFKFPDTSSMTDPQRESAKQSFQRNAEAAENRSEAQVSQWRSLAADPVYSSVDSEYSSAINLMKEHPEVAKKVFNLLRKEGSVFNQVASAAQAGMGVSFGNMAANINVPIEAFSRAGLNPEQQMVADRLLRAMIVVGNAKLASQGITPEKGQESYKSYMEGTKASLQQNASTALHNLEKDYITFQQNKKLYDQVTKEHRKQQQHSPTPYTDVINNSSEIQRINQEARDEMKKREKYLSDAIKIRSEKRRAEEGR